MRQGMSAALWLVALLLCMNLAGARAHAASYDNSYLKGGYSFLLNRWTATANDFEDGVVGRLNFDGAGGATGAFEQMQGGTRITNTLSGTYSVSANGSGSMTLTNPQGNTVDLAFALNSVANHLAMDMQLMTTVVASGFELFTGTAVLQSAGPVTFTNSYLKGRYTHLANRWVRGSDAATLSVDTFDGIGNMKFSYVRVKGSTVTKGKGTGTYVVNPDGTALLTVVYSNGSSDQVALVLNSVEDTVAKGFQFLLMTPTGRDMVNSGNAFLQ